MGNGEKILVVDDDPDIIEQLEAILKAEGYEVFTACGEMEAGELFSSVSPDLIVLDLMMEHVDSGFVLAHRFKKLNSAMPVILLTAVTASTGMSFNAQSKDAKSWLKADVILDKPIRPEQIKEHVARLLKYSAHD